jgi:hypothetical protein
MKILLFLFLFNNQSEIQINNKDSKHNFIHDSNKLLIFKNDSLTTINLDTGLSIKEFIVTQNINFSNFLFRKINDVIYLFQKSGGLVYKLVGNEIRRVDYSYEHKLQHKSFEFEYRNKLYRFGGYDFFDRSTIITYFDEKNREWELFYNYEDKLRHGINDFTFGFVKDKIVFTFGGMINNDGGKSHKFTRNSYSINLNNNEINLIGKLPQNFPKKFINYVKSKNRIYLLKDKNTLYIYDIPTKSYLKTFIKFKIEKLIGVYNDNLYYFTSQTTNSDKIIIKKLKIDQLKLTNFNQLFENYSYWMYVPFLLIILFLIFNRDLIKNKTLLKIKYGVLYDQKDKQIFLQEKQLDLVLYFFHVRKSNNSEILEFIGNERYNISHQNRVKNKLINGINQIIYSRTNEKLILVKTDRSDKRSKVYSINKKLL